MDQDPSPTTSTKCNFKPIYFNKPTWCDRCGKFIKGIIGKQGASCTKCGYNVHFKCQSLAENEECSGSRETQERQRTVRKKEGQNRLENDLKSLDNRKNDEEYQKKLFSIIDSASNYKSLVENNYLEDPNILFAIPEKFSDANLKKSFEDGTLYNGKVDPTCKKERVLLIHNLPEILKTESNFNKIMGYIMHTWLKQLAHLNFLSHDIPTASIFNTIFNGFPKLYWNQIDRWRKLLEDIDKYGLTIEGITKRFLPDKKEELDQQMSVYINHCKLMKQEHFTKELENLKLLDCYKIITKVETEKNPRVQDLNTMLLEPFQRLCRYPLLMNEFDKTLTKINNINYKLDKELLKNSLSVIKSFVNVVNDEVRKEEERSLYSKIEYNSEIVFGKNPDKVIMQLDKPNLKLQSGQDLLVAQADIKLLDFTDNNVQWKDDIHITVCDSFVIFCKKVQRNSPSSYGTYLDSNIMSMSNNNSSSMPHSTLKVYEILPHPHPTDSTEFRSLIGLDEDTNNHIQNSKLIPQTDLVYRAFVEATHTRGKDSFRHTLTIAQKVIRFGSPVEREEFYKKISNHKSPRLTSSVVSSATTSRGNRNPRRHHKDDLKQSKSHQLESMHRN